MTRYVLAEGQQWRSVLGPDGVRLAIRARLDQPMVWLVRDGEDVSAQ